MYGGFDDDEVNINETTNIIDYETTEIHRNVVINHHHRQHKGGKGANGFYDDETNEANGNGDDNNNDSNLPDQKYKFRKQREKNTVPAVSNLRSNEVVDQIVGYGDIAKMHFVPESDK